MKAPHSIDKEIEVVETIIAQLKHCLKIYNQAKMYREMKITKKDIHKCRVELKRLYAKRNTEQGEPSDGAKIW